MPLELPKNMRLIGRLHPQRSARGNIWWRGRVDGRSVYGFGTTTNDGVGAALELYVDTSQPPASPVRAARPKSDKFRESFEAARGARPSDRHRRPTLPTTPAPNFIDDELQDVLPYDTGG